MDEKEIVTLRVNLEGLKGHLAAAIMLRHEEIEAIINEKMAEVLSTDAVVNKIRRSVENVVEEAVEEFFGNRGEGYSLIRDAIQNELLAVMAKKILPA